MNLFTLPLRHTRAKWFRSLMLTAVFMLGLAAMTGLYQVSWIIADSFERKLISYGANVLITPHQEMLKIGYGGYVLGDVAVEEEPILLDNALPAIESIELRANVAIIAPKMLAATRVNDQLVTLVGVDWQEELRLKGYWEVTGEYPAAGDALLAGATVAARLGLNLGDVVNVDGQVLTLSAILHPTGSDDDTAMFVSLPVAQRVAGKPGQAAFIEVAALCSGCPIEDIVDQLQAALPGTEVRALAQVAESRMYAVHFAHHLALTVSLVILVTACAMLVMSMLSSVAERKKEIGILRAVGFSRARVFCIFVAEAMGIGLLAGAAGYAFGLVLASQVLERMELVEGAAIPFQPLYLVVVALVAALAAGVAAAFPAWRASLVEPAEALVAI